MRLQLEFYIVIVILKKENYRRLFKCFNVSSSLSPRSKYATVKTHFPQRPPP